MNPGGLFDMLLTAFATGMALFIAWQMKQQAKLFRLMSEEDDRIIAVLSGRLAEVDPDDENRKNALGVYRFFHKRVLAQRGDRGSSTDKTLGA